MSGISEVVLDRPADLRKPRLLLAEDDFHSSDFLCECLRPKYEVEAVTDGEQAWASAQREPPDLVLSDVIMPGMDGFALARRLRQHRPTAKVPIILFSASSAIDLMVRGLLAGADDVLLKPIHVEELLEILESRLAAVNNEADEDLE